jgi:mono/diheme cytochrome c family protein
MIARRAVHRMSLALLASAIAGCAPMPPTAAAEPASAPTFEAAAIAKGAQLSAIGDCRVCHTVEGGKAFAGGRPLPTPFGTIYATNITPDADTGIGRWSLAQFRRAMREGIDRAGRHLYPVFPYDHFTLLDDEDVAALYAYIMTREPVNARTARNRVTFPANVRPLLAAWKWLYLDDRRFVADPRQSAQWNRGAYLVEGLGHCGACHTPRNVAGAEKKDRRFAGGEAEGWHAPALLAASPAPLAWSAEALYRYLRNGYDADHGLAAGPMAPVVDGLARVPEADVRAMVTYLASLANRTDATPARETIAAAERRAFDPAGGHVPDRATESTTRAAMTEDAGEIIFAGACGTCHYAGRALPGIKPVPLALTTSVNAPTPRNMLQIVLDGVHPEQGEAGAIMPGFGDALTHAQVVAVVEYVRARFSDVPKWDDVDATLRRIEKERRP